jgi:hypothetical protein
MAKPSLDQMRNDLISDYLDSALNDRESVLWLVKKHLSTLTPEEIEQDWMETFASTYDEEYEV